MAEDDKRGGSTKQAAGRPSNGGDRSGASGSRVEQRGFASMDRERQREIASKGGQASPGNFKNNPGRAAEAGRKGGQASHGGQGGNSSR